MQYVARFLVEAPTPAIGQAAKVAAEQAIVNAGATLMGTSISRQQETYQVFGVVCDTGQRWQWRGEADDEAEAEAAALAARPPTSRVAVIRSV